MKVYTIDEYEMSYYEPWDRQLLLALATVIAVIGVVLVAVVIVAVGVFCNKYARVQPHKLFTFMTAGSATTTVLHTQWWQCI